MRTVTKTDRADVLVLGRGGRLPGDLREELARVEPDSKERVRVAAGERPEHDLPLELRQGDDEP